MKMSDFFNLNNFNPDLLVGGGGAQGDLSFPPPAPCTPGPRPLP